jgi:hypothetical protein
MSDTDGPSTDSTFKPDPPERVRLYQVVILFFYHIVLALFLAYTIYNVWPPQPWPGDRAKAQATPSPTPSPASNPANANSNPGVANANSAARSNVNAAPNSNSGSNSNSNSASTANANSNANAAGANSNTSGSAASNSNAIEAAISPYEGKLPPAFKLFWWWFQPTLETRLILLVLLAGAIGSYVHAASSLVDYLGNRTLISSWVWWYLLRPFIGMMLALIFYFGFRGGFITGGVNTGSEGAANFINPFGVAAMAGLVGMFSKVAADKLNEVFLTLFRPATGQGDAKRGDKLSDSFVPSIGSLSANTGPTTGGTTVTITGTGFMPGASVTFGGTPATAVVVTNATSITAITPAHAAGVVDVEVTNTNKQKVTLKEGFTYKA